MMNGMMGGMPMFLQQGEEDHATGKDATSGDSSPQGSLMETQEGAEMQTGVTGPLNPGMRLQMTEMKMDHVLDKIGQLSNMIGGTQQQLLPAASTVKLLESLEVFHFAGIPLNLSSFPW